MVCSFFLYGWAIINFKEVYGARPIMEDHIIDQLESIINLIRKEPRLRDNDRVKQLLNDALCYTAFDEQVILNAGSIQEIREHLIKYMPSDYNTTDIVLELLDAGDEKAAKVVCEYTQLFIGNSPNFHRTSYNILLKEVLKRGNTSFADYLQDL